jgi:hypothetical protein
MRLNAARARAHTHTHTRIYIHINIYIYTHTQKRKLFHIKMSRDIQAIRMAQQESGPAVDGCVWRGALGVIMEGGWEEKSAMGGSYSEFCYYTD